MARRAFVGVCLALGGIVPLLALTDKADVAVKAHDIHFHSIVVDTHDDTTQRLLLPGFNIAERHNDGSIDIPRMREGGLGAIFFSIWVSGKEPGAEAFKHAMLQIEAVRNMAAQHSEDLALVTTAAGIRRAHAEGKIAVLMGVEGGHMINDSMANLDEFARLGVRYMTLTHMVNNDWADSSTDTPAHNGLTDFGKQVVREMNRKGVIVDISHVADKTFYDALDTSEAPLLASHSSCRALCDAPRNMTDDMIKALAAKGGVIQINYHVGFLSQKFKDAEQANSAGGKAIAEEAKKRCGADDTCQLLEVNKIVQQYMNESKLPRVEWTEIIDHIDHAVKLVGADHVGLGSDFDGAVMPMGMEDVSHLPQITLALLQKGYSESDVRKILGGNTLRLIEQVEATAKRLGG